MKDDIAQGEVLTSLMKGIDSSPVLSQLVPPEKIMSIYNRMVANSGVEDPEELSIDIEEFVQEQQMQQQMAQEQAMAQQQGMQQGLPQGQVDPSQIPEAEVIEQAPEDPLMEIGVALQDAGVPDELIPDALDMAERGATPDEVFAAIEEVMSDAGR